jgi:folate-binding protein YgfZ
MTPSAQSISTPQTDANATSSIGALLHGTGIARLEKTGWIRVTGEDRVRWLNGMVTNSIQQMTPGEGTYNFLLSVQGRIQGDASIFAEPNALLIETSLAQVPGMIALLDHYIIMDDVELTEVSTDWSGLLIAGPQAVSLLGRLGLAIEETAPLDMRTVVWGASMVHIIHAYSPLVPQFELWADGPTTAKLYEALLSTGAVVCDEKSLEWLRILEGTPRYGTDIRDRELPQETAQDRALHFAKGCYLGQEIVERIRSRGNVHRTFCGFRLEGQLPLAGVALEAEGKQVGELTSVAAVPIPAPDNRMVQLGLGYVRREALDRGLPLLYAGGTAKPVSLPFFSAAASEPHPASESF